MVTSDEAPEFPSIKSKKYKSDKNADKERRRLLATAKSTNTEYRHQKTFMQALMERVSPLRRPKQYEQLDAQEQSKEMITQFE